MMLIGIDKGRCADVQQRLLVVEFTYEGERDIGWLVGLYVAQDIRGMHVALFGLILEPSFPWVDLAFSWVTLTYIVTKVKAPHRIQ